MRAARATSGAAPSGKTVDGDTIVGVAGHLYDAQEWIAGRTLSDAPKGDGPSPNVAVRCSSERLLALADPSATPTEAQGKAHEYNLSVLLGCLEKALGEAEALAGGA